MDFWTGFEKQAGNREKRDYVKNPATSKEKMVAGGTLMGGVAGVHGFRSAGGSMKQRLGRAAIEGAGGAIGGALGGKFL